MKTKVLTILATLLCSAWAFGQKPNIVVITTDDVAPMDISAYHRGLGAVETPNIDRIAKEGLMLSDFYAHPSCTAGRAAFITGQYPIRTGLTSVGQPGSHLGMQAEDVTLAELLKDKGYATAQFGKSHVGDRNEHLPTVHGFDEFFGNLYHLNAEEAPEHENYPKDPEFRQKFGPRGVLKSNADGKVEDTGPLTKKRMETIDQEFLDATIDFIERKEDEDTPWFCWFNPSRMHYHTHVPDEYKGKSGLNVYADGMIQHDDQIGELLNKLDELDIAENTIVIYTTDNGVHFNMWPDGGVTPFRGEKNTNWEGGYRVPFAMRWPDKIKAGQIENGITSHTDWVPTLMAAVGEDDIKEKLKKGHKVGDMTYKVHVDGYNLLPNLIDDKNKQEWPRQEFFYWSDDGDLVAYRYDRWKLVFMEQKASQFRVWMEPFTALRVPLLFDLRMDPYERASTDANGYYEWMERGLQFLAIPAQAKVGEMISTFQEYPPRQKPAKFNLEEVMNNMMNTPSNN